MLETSETRMVELAFLSLNEEMDIHVSKTWWKENNQRETISDEPYAGKREQNMSSRNSMNRNSKPRRNNTALGQ